MEKILTITVIVLDIAVYGTLLMSAIAFGFFGVELLSFNQIGALAILGSALIWPSFFVLDMYW